MDRPLRYVLFEDSPRTRPSGIGRPEWKGTLFSKAQRSITYRLRWEKDYRRPRSGEFSSSFPDPLDLPKRLPCSSQQIGSATVLNRDCNRLRLAESDGGSGSREVREHRHGA